MQLLLLLFGIFVLKPLVYYAFFRELTLKAFAVLACLGIIEIGGGWVTGNLVAMLSSFIGGGSPARFIAGFSISLIIQLPLLLLASVGEAHPIKRVAFLLAQTLSLALAGRLSMFLLYGM